MSEPTIDIDMELSIKRLIVDALKLEDVSPEEIASDEPLFGAGLGLDSIDALELGVAIRQRYGIRIETITDESQSSFRQCPQLGEAFIESRQAQ